MEKGLKIMLIVMLVITVALLGAAVAGGGSDAMIGYNLLWAYFLIAFAVASALFSAAFSMIQSPAGIKATIISLVLIVVIIGGSYAIAAGNPVQISDISNGGFFDEGSTLLTDVSILVTYVAMVGAILVSLGSELMGVVLSFKSSKTALQEEQEQQQEA